MNQIVFLNDVTSPRTRSLTPDRNREALANLRRPRGVSAMHYLECVPPIGKRAATTVEKEMRDIRLGPLLGKAAQSNEASLLDDALGPLIGRTHLGRIACGLV